MVTYVRWLAVVLLVLGVGGCTGVPDNITPVSPFDINRYLGKWYEIARLDHSFERGMEDITAEYSMIPDGGVRVLNSGYLVEDNKWKTAEGKAYFVDEPDKGHLKVSFSGPFYGSYVIFELDQQGYQYAFITSYDKSYLWLLSRRPDVAPEIRERFVQLSGELGYATDQLIFVSHDRHAHGKSPGVR